MFLIVEGGATFETYSPRGRTEPARSSGEITVGENEAIRFAPGEFQSGKNDSDGEVVILALGAPKGTEDWRIPVTCPECGHDDTRPTVADGGTPVLACPDCGAESMVECSECGSDDKRVIPGDDGKPVDVCLDCGAESVAR